MDLAHDSAAVIVGLGSDLCNIERIQASLDRFGDRFEARVFTDIERAKAERRPLTKAGTLCQALCRQGSLFEGGRHRLQGRGVFMKDIGVVNAALGRADAGADRRREGEA
jgi:holo-[acyl-carrier protein] synthase